MNCMVLKHIYFSYGIIDMPKQGVSLGTIATHCLPLHPSPFFFLSETNFFSC